MKRFFTVIFIVVSFFMVSCGGSDTDDSGNTGDTGDTGNTGNSGDTGDTGDTGNSGNTGDTGDTASGDKYCMKSCSTAADCASNENALMDENNWECKNGGCHYTGCTEDAECEEVYARTQKTYKCDKDSPYGVAQCVLACSTAADCDPYGTGSTENAYDFDNYKCESGYCRYIGCKNDSECEATWMDDSYACQDTEMSDIKTCQIKCSTADDCANAAYSAEAYKCEGSRCILKNCSETDWCSDVYGEDFGCYEY